MLSSTSATTTMVNLPPKRRTHDFTKAQRHKLQATFNKYSGFIDVATKDDLAREFDEDEALIRRWFRNRRAQAKLKNKMLSSTTATTTENIHPKRRGRPFTRAQRNILEASFNKNNGYIGRADKHDLAQELDLDEASVKAWFESRRAKVRRQIKPTTSEIRDAVAQTPAMETTSAKQSTGNRQLFDLSKLQPEQSIINTGRCFGLRKEVQNQQSGLPSKQSHTTEIGKPEADSLSSVAASLDGRSENTCKDVNFTGLLGTPKASNTGIADKQVSSPLMVYNIQKFSPTAVSRVLPVNENPRDHYDGRHVMKTGTPHLPHERPSTKLRGIVPKSAVSSSPSERQGQGHPQDGDECSNAPSSNEQLRSHSENSGKCPRHVPMSTQLPSKSVMDRTQKTVVPDKDTLVHEGLPGEITDDMLSSTTATTITVIHPKRRKLHYTKAQSNKLEATLNKNDGYIDPAERDALAQELHLDKESIWMWFCNRRSTVKGKDDMLSSTTATTIENIPPRRRRRRFTVAQLRKLEASFNKNEGYIDSFDNADLAQELDLDEPSVRIWFQNRRAKVKRQIKPTTSWFAHPIHPSVAQTPAMETTAPTQSTGYRKPFDLSNLQPKQNIINTGTCFNSRTKLQSQQSGLLPNHCYKQSHTTEIRKPEADSFSSAAVSLDGRSENTCKGSASDVNYTGLLGKPKLDKVSNQISVEAPYTGIGDKQVSSPLMVYNVQKFNPAAVPRVLPVKENPRDHYDGWHVTKTGTPHLPHERPSTKLRGMLPKSALSPSPSERQGQGHPQYGDGCSNAPSSNDQIRSHSGNSGMCLPHVPMSTQLPSKSVMDRTQKTVVPEKDTLVDEGLPGEITVEPKEYDDLNNYSHQELSSVERSLDTDDPNTQHPALDKVSFFSAMCEIDTDWTPLPDDVAVMFNSYRESPDCSGGVDITDAAESEATVMEKNVYLPILPC
ncbi:uncharacterized protein LOC124289924 isoform X2 [Haliotis rubra]|nr:uncharacterized protein LOC124289924 isoform X2 [Haliotis rubra]